MLHQPPGELCRKVGKAPARRQADGLEDHAHATLDVAEAVISDCLGEVRGNAAIVAIGQCFRLVAAMEREGQLVILAFADTSGGDAEALEDADALLRGRFRFDGDTLDILEGSVFDKQPPSRDWLEALHSFAWLPPLAAAGGDPARTLATNLISQWVKRYPRYSEPEWSPHVMARRLIQLFVHGRFVIPNSDMLWRSRLFVSLREQSRQLARIADKAPDGFTRFETAAALALAGACLDHSPKRLL